MLQYLSGTAEFTVEAERAPSNRAVGATTVGGVTKGPDVIEIWSDSNHGGERPGTTLSQTGVMITLNGAPVHWSSRKQVQGTAYSSAMAEIYALSDTVRAGRLYRRRCEEMGMCVDESLVVQVGSSAAVSFQRRLHVFIVAHQRVRVDMRVAWVRELRDDKLVGTQKVTSEENLADGLTKGMPNYKFQQWLRRIDPSRETVEMRKEMAFLAYLRDVC